MAAARLLEAPFCDYDYFVHGQTPPFPPAYSAIYLGYPDEPSFMCKECYDRKGVVTAEMEPDPAARAQYFHVVLAGRKPEEWLPEWRQKAREAFRMIEIDPDPFPALLYEYGWLVKPAVEARRA